MSIAVHHRTSGELVDQLPDLTAREVRALVRRARAAQPV